MVLSIKLGVALIYGVENIWQFYCHSWGDIYHSMTTNIILKIWKYKLRNHWCLWKYESTNWGIIGGHFKYNKFARLRYIFNTCEEDIWQFYLITPQNDYWMTEQYFNEEWMCWLNNKYSSSDIHDLSSLILLSYVL